MRRADGTRRRIARAAFAVAAAMMVTAPSDMKKDMPGRIRAAAPLRLISTLPDGAEKEFHYYLASRFADDMGFDEMQPAWTDDEGAALDLLRGGAADIVICPDTVAAPGFLRSRSLKNVVWMLRENDAELLAVLNGWLSDIMKAYDRTYGTAAVSDVKKGIISPYDTFVRRAADKYGLDWRLLSSVIYHESRFENKAVSGKGAVGLMQIVTSVHDKDNLHDPGTNIDFGAGLMGRLIKSFENYGANSTEALKFALAAYNIGSARMLRYISYAAENNADCTRLDGVMDAVTDMEGFSGSRVGGYVDSVLNTYYDYTRLYGK